LSYKNTQFVYLLNTLAVTFYNSLGTYVGVEAGITGHEEHEYLCGSCTMIHMASHESFIVMPTLMYYPIPQLQLSASLGKEFYLHNKKDAGAYAVAVAWHMMNQRRGFLLGLRYFNSDCVGKSATYGAFLSFRFDSSRKKGVWREDFVRNKKYGGLNE